MKVLVIGKRGSIVHWTEDTAQASSKLGHEVAMFGVNGTTPGEMVRNKLAGLFNGFGEEQAAVARLQELAATFKPNLTVFVLIGANWLPWYQAVRLAAPHSILAGRVGDKFSREQSFFCNHLDHLFVSAQPSHLVGS